MIWLSWKASWLIRQLIKRLLNHRQGTCPSSLVYSKHVYHVYQWGRPCLLWGMSIMSTNEAVLVNSGTCPSCLPMWPSLFTPGHVHHVYQCCRPSLLWDMSIMSTNVAVLVYTGTCHNYYLCGRLSLLLDMSMSTNMAVLVYSGPCPLCLQMWPSLFTLGHVHPVYQCGSPCFHWGMSIMSTNVAV